MVPLQSKTNLCATNRNLLRKEQAVCSYLINTAVEQGIGRPVWHEVSRQFFLKVRNLIHSRGLAFTVKYVKASRLCVTKYLSGEPLKESPGVRLNAVGWPKWLNFIIMKDPTVFDLKMLLTLLTSLRHLQLEPVLDLTPIEKPFSGCDLKISKREHRNILRWIGITKKLRKRTYWTRYHYSTKSGPNGQALLTSLQELCHLPPDLESNIKLLGGSSLSRSMDECRKPIHEDHSAAELWSDIDRIGFKDSFRRLSYFSDKEAKTRVIAIFDYWSQTCLKPLHDTLMDILKKNPQDCTFNQGSFAEKLRSPQSNYHSLDLTTATDRLPIHLQCKVIAPLLGSKRIKAWKDVMVEHPFRIGGQEVYYGAGQPMGAYSSWPAMAITHHYIVKLAGLKAHINNFSNYVVLGDDIVIGDDRVAVKYREIMSTLDVPINPNKTHTSPTLYEFAKRWVYQGREVTPFAVGGLLEVWKHYPLLTNFWKTQQSHGWFPEKECPDLITSSMTALGRPQLAKRIRKLARVFNCLLEAKERGDFSGEILRSLQEEFALSDQVLGLNEKDVMAKCLIKQLNSDLENLQGAQYVYTIKHNSEQSKKFPDLCGQRYRAVLREHAPLQSCLRYMSDDIVMMIIEMQMMSPDEDVSMEKALEWLDLSKSRASKGTFTMRQSHSRAFATARLVKLLLEEVKGLTTA